jgi:hypothetical protein
MAKHKAHTTRDQRCNIKMAHQCSLNEAQIAQQQDLTVCQARYALQKPDIPKKRSRHPFALTHDQREDLIEFVTSSNRSRRMTCEGLAKEFF